MMLSKVAQIFQRRNLAQPSIGAVLEKKQKQEDLDCVC